MLQINEYQKKAHETASYPCGTIGEDRHSATYIYPALGLSEEAGEVAGKLAKAVRDNEGVVDGERLIAVKKELGDVCWFVAELCTCFGFELEDVMQKNLDKLASRKARGVIHGSGDDR